MSDTNPTTGLEELALQAAHLTHPPPPTQIRRQGDRRRRRRHIAIGAAALVVVATAGGALAQGTPSINRPPPYAAGSPTPDITAIPARTIDSDNLLQAGDIPTDGSFTVEVVDPGIGRTIDEASVCQRTGLAPVNASQALSRNFLERYHYGPGETPDPSAPLTDLPNLYTVALQFSDEAEARHGYTTYREWVEDCPAALATEGYDLPSQRPVAWEPVPTASGESVFTELIYTEPGGDADQDGGYFESIGLTVVGDRMMITVYLVFGMDHNTTYGPTPDPSTGLPPHPLYAINAAAAERLER